jgi:hypothetical protein
MMIECRLLRQPLQASKAWLVAGPLQEKGADNAASNRQRLRLPIDSAEQLPAAEAVIAALYGVPDALSSLEQQQLVDAVVLGDMLGAAAVAAEAVQLLKAAADHGAGGLSAAALDALADLPAWPACLQPLLLPVVKHASCCDASLADLTAITAADTGSRVQRMLLAVLGDLEAVWRDEQLQQLLLDLPLPALQLLLSSDQLRVASEDTVLYTASQYRASHVWDKAAAAVAALAPTVRVPHLSRFALSGQVFCTDSNLLLSSYSKQLKQLASYKLIAAGDTTPEDVLEDLAGAPASWSLGKRQIVASDGVRLLWRLPVEELAQACRDSFATSSTKNLYSPDSTPPLGAVAWQLNLALSQVEADGVIGTTVGLFVLPQSGASGVSKVFSCTVGGPGTSRTFTCDGWLAGVGYPDIFKLGPMSAGGGWDEAAWAAKGLPTSGVLELTLHMHSVGSQL